MNKKFRKFMVVMLALVLAFSLSTVSVIASNFTQNTQIRLDLNASRPLLSGAPRGTTTTTARDTTSFGIRARTRVLNSNGTTTTPNAWDVLEGTSSGGITIGIGRGQTVTSRQTIGSTRSGTVIGEGYRRTFAGVWNSSLNLRREF